MSDDKKKSLEITKATQISETLDPYGDIANMMDLFGVKRVTHYFPRVLADQAMTVNGRRAFIV